MGGMKSGRVEAPGNGCLLFFFLDGVSLLLPRLELQWHDLGSRQPPPPRFKRFSCLSFQNSWDYRHAPSYLARFYYYYYYFILFFLVETGFVHDGQAGLKLLTSGNLPTLASQSVGIASVSHRSQWVPMIIWRALGRLLLPGFYEESFGKASIVLSNFY